MDPQAFTELGLTAGRTYRIKIYDEQPFADAAPHRQIRAESLGKVMEGKYLGQTDCERGEGIMLEFDIAQAELVAALPRGIEVRGGMKGSFHLWLVESITPIDRTKSQWQEAIDEDMRLLKSSLVNADGTEFDAVHELAVARKEARRLARDIERYAKDSFGITLEQLDSVQL